jgi:hypothetical protein
MVRKEVPLSFVAPEGKAENKLTDYTALQRILLSEEQQAYERAKAAAAGWAAGGRLGALGALLLAWVALLPAAAQSGWS